MFGLDRRVARATWTVLVFAAVIGAAWAMRRLIALFAFSVFFAYLVFPLVKLTQRLPFAGRRWVAIGLVYVVLLLGLGSLGTAVVPRLTTEVATLTQKIPEMSAKIQSGEIVGSVLNKPGWADQRVHQLEQLVRSHAGQIIPYVQKAATAGLKLLAGAWIVVLIPIFGFFILKDAEVFVAAMSALIEDRPHRQLWRAIAADVHVLLAQYVRALVLLSLVTFGVWSALFLVMGVPYAMVLAAIGGALEFIPLVGPLTAGIVVVSTSLVAGFAHPWLLAGFIVVWRLVQDYGTSPLVMGRGIEMHPALVIFGVIAGGEIAGPVGMFLSVPAMAAVRVVWRRLQDFRARRLLRPGPGP